MKNIISLQTRKPFELYFYPWIPRWNFDWSFVLVIALTILWPQITFCSYFGNLAGISLGTVAALGTILGAKNYFRPPEGLPSCVPHATAQAPSKESLSLKLAA